jgi:O-antigen/teichoic acid export membrane protein
MNERFDLKGRSLRAHTARGSLINAAFLGALSSLGFIRGFVLAAFLLASDYGVWGLATTALLIVSAVQQVGIGDRYIQQDDPDQELAFQKAFSLSLLAALGAMGASLLVLPLFVVIYDEPKILIPGLVLTVNYLSIPFQLPIWFHYRRMDFFRQRALQAVDPIVGFIVAVGLAIAGAGYWALFGGAIAGLWGAALAASLNSPYKYRWRYDRGTMRDYWSFSWPLVVAGLGGVLIAQAAFIATDAHLGIAAAGALTLASTVTLFTDRIDGLVTGTLYPAIVAVKEKRDVLYESFVKSNRLALMWAVPFGFGLSLFCRDLVDFLIGEKWAGAIPLLEVFGVVAALGHIGFNWNAYFRAIGDTKPMAVAAAAASITFLVVGIPALLVWDMYGLAAGVAAQMVAHVACRAYYLARLFDGFGILAHASRSILPSVPAVGAVLLARLLESGERTAAIAAGELVLYLAITAVATLLLERPLLREAAGYLSSAAARR